jgi:hypothetical protein
MECLKIELHAVTAVVVVMTVVVTAARYLLMEIKKSRKIFCRVKTKLWEENHIIVPTVIRAAQGTGA